VVALAGPADNPAFLCQTIDPDGDADLRSALSDLELDMDDDA
jgi:hypothetical protein